MTVSQQIILHMVQDNTVISVYEKADILSYKYFTSDYNYLQFVMNRFVETGLVTLGELCIKFPEFPTDYQGASQNTEFLIYQLKELYVYNELYSAVQEGQEKFPNDGIQLLGFLEDTIRELRTILPTHEEYDLISHAQERYDNYLKVTNDPNSFIPTGFAEVDKLIGGWSRSGELAAFLARMGMGKTWLLVYSCISAWKAGFRCGFISIEMGKNDIGYRVDTLLSGLSNTALRRGEAVNMGDYKRYLQMLEGKSGIILRSKKDFGGHITPSAIHNWIKNSGIQCLYIDGLSYIENERKNASTKSEASSITDVSEDLMAVSTDLQCPIIVTAQANRGGADRSLNPQLEHVRGSDGIAINASFVASIAYPSDDHRVITMEALKCRYGTTGHKWNFDFLPDSGYIQSRGEITQTGGAFFGS